MGNKHKKRTYVVEVQFKRLPWVFLSRHKTFEEASAKITVSQLGQDRTYRVVEERCHPHQTKPDRYYLPLILWNVVALKAKSPQKVRRHNPHRWDVMVKLDGIEWFSYGVFKSRVGATRAMNAALERWKWLGVTTNIIYRREDKKGNTYYVGGKPKAV